MCLPLSSLFWFLGPTWSGIQFNIFRTVVPITTKQELLSVKCSISTHAHMHTHTYVHVRIHMHIPHVHAHTHTHVHSPRHIHTRIASTHMCTHTCIHLYVYSHMHTCARAQIWACIHIHMHKSTYIHTQACPGLLLHIHRKHSVRTDKHHQDKVRIKTIYGHFWFSAKAGGFGETVLWQRRAQ